MIVPDLCEDGALPDEPREAAGEIPAKAVQVIRTQLIDGQQHDEGRTLPSTCVCALLGWRRHGAEQKSQSDLEGSGSKKHSRLHGTTNVGTGGRGPLLCFRVLPRAARQRGPAGCTMRVRLAVHESRDDGVVAALRTGRAG